MFWLDVEGNNIKLRSFITGQTIFADGGFTKLGFPLHR